MEHGFIQIANDPKKVGSIGHVAAKTQGIAEKEPKNGGQYQ